ncbi:MAG: SLC13 family permease [Anaerolineae bacterium]|nr:SLC13 family permease [Anaerolineae bacterium]
MTLPAAYTLAILIATLLVMASQRLRSDLTALLVMLALILGGILAPEEAFRAFGQPVIIIVACIYVIGAALYETGVATVIADGLLRFRRHGNIALLAAIMVVAGLMSAVVSDLLVVSVLLPAVLRLARRAGLSPGQLLMPMTTAAVMGDMLTLIGAISTVAINDVLVASGHPSLGLFTLTPYGIAALAIAVVWYLLHAYVLGGRFFPSEKPEVVERPSLDEVERTYALEEQLYQLRVRAGSDLVGHRLHETGLGAEFRLNVVAVQPSGADLQPPRPGRVVEQDDVLVVAGKRGDVHQAANRHHLHPRGSLPLDRFEAIEGQSLRLAELMIPYRSPLVGKTLQESQFRDRYGLNVLGIHREGRPLRTLARDDPSWQLRQQTLQAGDTLLVQGPYTHLQAATRGSALLLVTHLGPQRGDVITRQARLTVAVLGAMLLTVVAGWLPLAVAAIAAVLALILGRAISVEQAYRSVDASVLVLIGAMLPLATALEETGLARLLAEQIGTLAASIAPLFLVLAFYLLTALLTQVVSNTVTGVLLVPIAINLADSQGLPAAPFAIAIIIAVTTSYLTPLIQASNLMMRGAGSYKMRHFLLGNGPVFVLQVVAVMALLQLFYFSG